MNDFIQELAVRSFLIAAVGLSVRLCLHKASAAARANVLMVTLLTLVALPLVQLAELRVPVQVAVVDVVAAPVAGSAVAPAAVATPWHWVWIAVATAFALKLGWSLLAFRGVIQKMSPAGTGLLDKVSEITSRRRFVLCSRTGLSPMTWGLFRPKIALPAESEEWDELQLRSVVLHEDAHIRRGDWAVSMGYQLAVGLYWFNPLVWVLRSLYERDSEQAADDWVLSQGLEAPDYAERLLRVATTISAHGVRLPVVTVMGTNDLKLRLQAILDARVTRRPLPFKARATVLSVLTTTGLASSLLVPVVAQRVVAPSAPSAPSVVSVVDSEGESSPVATVSHPPEVCLPEDAKTPVAPEKPKQDARPVADRKPVIANAKPVADKNPIEDLADFDPPSAADMSDLDAGMKEFEKGMKEAEKALKDAEKDVEKSIRDATKELEASDAGEYEKQIARAAMKQAAKLANGIVKGAIEGALSKPDKPKNQSPADPVSPPN
ncbi:MAG TPA: M56 family metallopeptidase [Fimbriimonas sp.]|nr:M56 family metallopeptidase [Fimbriimonas sp.]